MRQCTVLLLLSSFALAQESAPPPPVALRIMHTTDKAWVCSVLTLDGRVRREVTPHHGTVVGKTQFFDDAATNDDVAAAKTVTDDPATLDAAREKQVGFFMANPDIGGRMIFIDFQAEAVMKHTLFVAANGKVRLPRYVQNALSFAKILEEHKLPRLNGNPASLCGQPGRLQLD